MVASRPALTHHVEGLNLSPVGRHRCRPHDVAARTAWGVAKLGLPLLLAAGRHFYSPRTDERRLLRRGTSVGGVAAACRGWPAIASPNHVRPPGRAAPDGMGDSLVA